MFKLYFICFIVFSVTVFALYCPNCGTNNREHWRHCVRCGESLAEARKVLASEDLAPQRRAHNQKYKSNTEEVRTLRYTNQRSKAKVHQGTPGLRATKTQNSSEKLDQPAMTSQQIQQFIQNNTAQQLLRLQNQNIEQNQFMELQSDPKVQQLMNQMKSKQFQGQLMQGLRNLQQNMGKGGQSKLSGQMRQLESLFQLLNQQSAISQDLYQP